MMTNSVAQKLNYTLSLQYPSKVLPTATLLDNLLWSMLEKSSGLHIPREEEGSGTECVLDVPVRGLQGQSFQHWLVRLPVRERGMGLRSQIETIPSAFIGSVEMSLPFLCGEDGQLKQLTPVVGDIREAEEVADIVRLQLPDSQGVPGLLGGTGG